MRLSSVLASLFILFVSIANAQTDAPQPRWQSGTITSVKPHTAKDSNQPDTQKYDVSVKVGDESYVVLYTPPPGSNSVRYRAGTSLQVLISDDTLTFNDLLGRANKLPILRRDAPQDNRSQ